MTKQEIIFKDFERCCENLQFTANKLKENILQLDAPNCLRILSHLMFGAVFDFAELGKASDADLDYIIKEMLEFNIKAYKEMKSDELFNN